MLTKNILLELQDFVEQNTIKLKLYSVEAPQFLTVESEKVILKDEIDDFVSNNRKPSFSKVLFNFIDKKEAIDSEIYKRAGIDRRHFSKIRSNPNYHPSKNTVVSLALALELNKKEAEYLLSASGYTLSESDTFDLVIQFCINKKIYNIHDVNQALDYFSLKPIGGMIE